ncbi:MAG TPA: hypothetical protein VF046_11615 [Gemmatimonadales bacterium]
MFRTHPRRDQARESAGPANESVRYPTDHVVGILDTADQVRAAYQALTSSGFLESEVTVSSGRAAADALNANTGRTGLAHLAIRIAEKFGVNDEEMALKERYEEALRDGRFVVFVLTPTGERRERAASILRDHGAHTVNFLGKFAIEPLSRR